MDTVYQDTVNRKNVSLKKYNTDKVLTKICFEHFVMSTIVFDINDYVQFNKKKAAAVTA